LIVNWMMLREHERASWSKQPLTFSKNC
jgi:hypothetical protein